MIKLEWYRVFYEVAKAGSFSKAAEALYLTQPAVSQAIMQLEEQLEVQLFFRSTRGASLTKEGEILNEYVTPALQMMKTGERRLAELKDVTFGELTIGVGDSISKYYLLEDLETFHTIYPNIKFTLQNGTTSQLIELVKDDKVDIAICNLPIQEDQLMIIPTMTVQDTFVYGEKYDRLLSGEVSYEQLVQLPLIMLEKTSNSRQYVESWLLKNGVEPLPEFELGSHDLLIEFAKMNFGIAAVIREFSMRHLQSGVLKEVQFTQPIPAREIGICYKKERALSSAMKRFVQIVTEERV